MRGDWKEGGKLTLRETAVAMTQSTLGTLLRHLTDQLDADVEAFYRLRGLDYRPRFTPVMRVLNEMGEASIKDIQAHTTLTHSALSQTITEMTKRGLVKVRTGDDGRARIISLSERGIELLPALQDCWANTNKAAAELSRDANIELESVLGKAIAALRAESFLDRMLRIQQADEAREPER